MKVKVWNLNKYEYKEKFKGMNLNIPAGEYIEMDQDDAVQFRGTVGAGVQLTGDGQPDPKFFKKIWVQPHTMSDEEAIEKKPKRWVCQYDGREFPNEKSLNLYIEENYADQIYVDENIEKELVAKEQEKKKRGRPRKSA